MGGEPARSYCLKRFEPAPSVPPSARAACGGFPADGLAETSFVPRGLAPRDSSSVPDEDDHEPCPVTAGCGDLGRAELQPKLG